MGMFNYVRYTAPCSQCGAEITVWQTKDGPDELYLNTVTPERIGSGVFYAICECGEWNEFHVIPLGVSIVRIGPEPYDNPPQEARDAETA